MSMVMYLRRASDTDIARIGEDADALDHFVFEEGDQGSDLVDFDLAWHALHFMLCGEIDGCNHPLGIIACKLPLIGLDANGFGGFSFIPPVAMKHFAEALVAISDDELNRRYNPPAWLTHDLYRADMFAEYDAENSAETRAYIMQGVPRLRQFASSCAASGEGAIRILG